MEKVNEQSPEIQKSGYLLPWDAEANQPCMILIENIIFIPVFSDEEKLNEHLDFVQYKHPTTKKLVTDTDDFLKSVHPYRVALNPRNTERGTTRFTELTLG
jgi:hypothetical protein